MSSHGALPFRSAISLPARTTRMSSPHRPESNRLSVCPLKAKKLTIIEVGSFTLGMPASNSASASP